MRLVMVVPAFPRLSEAFLVAKFRGLLARGWDVHVVSESADADWEHFEALSSDPEVRRRVHRSAPRRPGWVVALAYIPVIARAVVATPRAALRYLAGGRTGLRRLYASATIVRLRPDVVHFESGEIAAGRMHLKQHLGCRLVVSFRGHDLNFVALELDGYYDEVWRNADTLHAFGLNLVERARARGCPCERSFVLIPAAVDHSEFDSGDRHHTDIAGTDGRPLRVLSVGRLAWPNGYEFGLQAVKELEDAGVRVEYRIIGDGPYDEDYMEGIAFARHQLSLTGVVEWCEERDPVELRRLFAWSDAFLEPAVSDELGTWVMEAQAMSVPVVCADADGMRESVENEVTGFVTPRRNPTAMANRLQKLALDQVLRDRMGRRGRARAIAQFSIDGQIDRFEQVYRAVWGLNSEPTKTEL